MANDVPSAPPDPWTEIFRSLICELYRVFGGSCESLDWTDGGATAVGTVRGVFEGSGLPQFTSQEEQDFVELLDSLETHINLGTATISPALKADVQGLIDDMREALEA